MLLREDENNSLSHARRTTGIKSQEMRQVFVYVYAVFDTVSPFS